MAWELPLLASRLHFGEVFLTVLITRVLPERPCVLSCLRALLEEGKATVPCLAERLTNELILHINKSLPLLEKQIRESHQRATEELHQCGDDIPSNEADRMFFLIEKIKMFNQDIEKLIGGEEVVKKKDTRLFNKIREDFESWVLVLTANTQKGKSWDKAPPKHLGVIFTKTRGYFWLRRSVKTAEHAHTRHHGAP